jgi:hypothetical protein
MATREPPVELFYRLKEPDPRARRRWWDWKNLRFDTGLRLIIRAKRLIANREPPVKLYYDVRQLDPDAPRLRIAKAAGRWELRDEEGAVLSRHVRLPEAIDAALERSKERFSEILVMGANGRFEWSVHHDPGLVELARVLNATVPSEREAAD